MNTALPKTKTNRHRAILIATLLISIFASLAAAQQGAARGNGTVFESPLPERTPAPSPYWVRSTEGGKRQYGAVTVTVPPGFTRQGGAHIRAFNLVSAVDLELPTGFITGTLFSVGIWPPNDQVTFEKPVELRLLLDPVRLGGGSTEGLYLAQFQPDTQQWRHVAGTLVPASYEYVANIRTFSPVDKDFPAWGGQTFFALVQEASGSDKQLLQPTVQRQANIRSGPGMKYKVLRVATAGEVIKVASQSADGKWLKLADGTWIAAVLVANVPVVPVAPD